MFYIKKYHQGTFTATVVATLRRYYPERFAASAI